MTNPVKALADAARRARVVLHNMTLEREGKLRMFSRWQISDEPLRNDAMHVVPDLDEALAAYDAAHTCGECEGSGVVRAVGPTGEFADQWQEPCPKCDTAQAQPAPSDATTPPTDDYDALGHAMEILGRCVTKYSCEQAQAVAKVLRQWRDKWALAVDSIPVAKPAPTDAEIREAIRRYGLAEFQFGKGAPVDDVVERHAEQKASLANLLAIIARLRSACSSESPQGGVS